MIPLATTTITVERVPNDPTRDGFDIQPGPQTIGTGVRAHIGAPSGGDNVVAGDRTTVTWHLDSDPIELKPGDTVTDDTTGDTFTVVWARQRQGLGLDHTVGALEQVRGAS